VPDFVRRPGRAELQPRAYRRRRRTIELGLAAGVPVVLLVLWQAASSQGWIDERIYPSPTDIVSRGRTLAADGALWHDVWLSSRRTLLGYALGAVTGAAAGLAMGGSRLLRAALEPLLSALYTVPKLALLPIFLTVFGFGERPVVVLIAVTVFFFVWISTTAAVLSVPDGYRDAARVFEVSRWQMFRHVVLPAALPQIFVGLRIAAGVAVLMLVGVEFVIASDGLGHLIEQGRVLFIIGQTYVGIVVVALLGLAFVFLVRFVGRLLTPWAKDDGGINQI
jgi:sulfonate transport system permease protein